MSERAVVPIVVGGLLLAGALSFGLYLWKRGPAPAPAPAATAPTTPPVPVGPGTPVTAQPTAPAAAEKLLTLPDGSRVPLLNGVDQVPAYGWPHDRPWSPIVGKIREGDLDYYVHADGSRSTTMMVWVPQRQRREAVGVVQNPAPVQPIPDHELPGGTATGGEGGKKQ